jgi:hypothetical protein
MTEAESASRRTFLARAAALGIAAPIGLVAGRVFVTPRVAPLDP